MYAGMGHFASGCACPGTDEVCFSCRSCIAPYASSQRPGKHHRIKSVPPGRAACIEKCRTKGFGALPQQAFCNAKVAVVYTTALLAIETLPSMIGQLVYIGEGLTLGSSNPEGLAAFSRIVAAAEDIFVSIHDGCSKFQFIFCLHDKVFVEDHAEQIAKIKEKIRLHRMETMQLHRMLSGKD